MTFFVVFYSQNCYQRYIVLYGACNGMHDSVVMLVASAQSSDGQHSKNRAQEMFRQLWTSTSSRIMPAKGGGGGGGRPLHATAVVESLQSGHFVVVASENEPCSVSLMESLALGLPALAARSGGNVDIVKDGETGVLFENGSAEDLKDKLVAILSGEIALRPPAEIRESVRGWAASAMTEKYNRIYDHMAQLNSAGL